ncbi:DUF58 domain-containing protein [Thiospirochaeta perfilievii]|uniref:DUF58 domain-containing protein n=1 Tax=Thiospirochaeta perfilievii TaxID=252967 RepID=A0A5C1Q9C5_9SPIO|nr:DUF58 domain-containing protein [Thiospirochaeta perfilievii]QEN03700.1 DUF58 domain-containing protein [Thiospirochaeta perfilievii]
MDRTKLSLLVFSIITLLIFPFFLIQMLSLFIIIIHLLSFLYSKYLYFNLDISFSKPIYYCNNREDEVVTITFRNRGYLPIDGALIHIRGNGCFTNIDGTFLTSLPPRGICSLDSHIITNVRGAHKIGPVFLNGSDPLNFFPWKKEIDISSEVVIYPKYQDINLIFNIGEKGGHHRVKNKMYEDQADLKSIREYRAGDSLKRINWKASAKVGSLQTMEFSNTLNSPLFILMDIDPLKYPIKQRYNYLERTIEVAASLVTSYSKNSNRCGLLTRDSKGVNYIPMAKGWDHTVAILDNLAKINFLNQKSESISIINTFFSKKINIPQGSFIYILLPKIDSLVVDSLFYFNRQRYNIKVVNTGGVSSTMKSSSYEFLTLTSYGKELFL